MSKQSSDVAESLIQKAQEKSPVSVYYKGRLSEEDAAKIEKVCDIHISSVYMDGSATYSIRYRRRE